MSTWLRDPISRAEAIAWSLCVPAVVFAGVAGWGVVGGLGAVRRLAHIYDQVPPPAGLQRFLAIGELGLAAAFVLCAAVPIGALLTRQRTWVRLVAPIACSMVAYALLHQYSASSTEWLRAIGQHLGVDASTLGPR